MTPKQEPKEGPPPSEGDKALTKLSKQLRERKIDASGSPDNVGVAKHQGFNLGIDAALQEITMLRRRMRQKKG